MEQDDSLSVRHFFEGGSGGKPRRETREGLILRLEQDVIITKPLHFSGQNNDLLVLEQRKGALIRVMPLLFGLPSLLSRAWLIYLLVNSSTPFLGVAILYFFYLILQSHSPSHDCQTSETENKECYSWV